jgi:hypothetical protein
VYRLDGAGGIHTHTALKVEKLNKLLIDQEGCLLIDSDIGIGVLEDRDLQRLLDAVTVDDHGCTDIDSAVTLLFEDPTVVFEARYCGAPCPLAAIDSDRVASAYGFKQTPSPPDSPTE